MRLNWDPFYELIQMQDRTDRLLQEGFGRRATAQLPAVDVFEENGRLITEVSLPNFDTKDVEVNLSNEGLEIKAQQTKEKDIKNRKYLMHETTTGSFYRYINMPAGARTDEAKASFDNGVLRVDVPIEQKAEPKKLEIISSNKISEESAEKS
jgi:HSP20 family protein